MVCWGGVLWLFLVPVHCVTHNHDLLSAALGIHPSITDHLSHHLPCCLLEALPHSVWRYIWFSFHSIVDYDDWLHLIWHLLNLNPVFQRKYINFQFSIHKMLILLLCGCVCIRLHYAYRLSFCLSICLCLSECPVCPPIPRMKASESLKLIENVTEM